MCHFSAWDCSEMKFEEMPVIEEADGVKIVRCVSYEKKFGGGNG